jgi:hypothetical protein
MCKNPIYENSEELKCGDLLEEIHENNLVSITGGGWEWTLGPGAAVASMLMGNGKGKLCTATVECTGCKKKK